MNARYHSNHVWILVAVGALLIGLAVAARTARPDVMTGEEVATEIEKFLARQGGRYDWDDFICVPLADAFLDQIRETASATHRDYPPLDGNGWCNEDGRAVLRELAARARAHAAALKMQRD